MIQAKTAFAAATFGLSLSLAALSASAFGEATPNGGAEMAAIRIAGAFAAAPTTAADPALQAAAAQAGKGDLGIARPCGEQLWPNLSADCLVSADGGAVTPVRSVTVGYQTDVSTTVLVRMPAPQLASR